MAKKIAVWAHWTDAPANPPFKPLPITPFPANALGNYPIPQGGVPKDAGIPNYTIAVIPVVAWCVLAKAIDINQIPWQYGNVPIDNGYDQAASGFNVTSIELVLPQIREFIFIVSDPKGNSQAIINRGGSTKFQLNNLTDGKGIWTIEIQKDPNSTMTPNAPLLSGGGIDVPYVQPYGPNEGTLGLIFEGEEIYPNPCPSATIGVSGVLNNGECDEDDKRPITFEAEIIAPANSPVSGGWQYYDSSGSLFYGPSFFVPAGQTQSPYPPANNPNLQFQRDLSPGSYKVCLHFSQPSNCPDQYVSFIVSDCPEDNHPPSDDTPPSTTDCSILCMLAGFVCIAVPISAYVSTVAHCIVSDWNIGLQAGIITTAMAIFIAVCGRCCLWRFILIGSGLSIIATAIAAYWLGFPQCWYYALPILIGYIALAVSIGIDCENPEWLIEFRRWLQGLEKYLPPWALNFLKWLQGILEGS